MGCRMPVGRVVLPAAANQIIRAGGSGYVACQSVLLKSLKMPDEMKRTGGAGPRSKLAEWAAVGGRWSILAAIVVAPTQWNILQVGSCHLTLADPLILLASCCWLVRLFSQEGWWRTPWPLPWQVAAFVLPALLSLFMVEREGMPDALREVTQLLEYFVAGYILFDDLLRAHPRRLRTVLYLLLGVTLGIVLLSVGQFFLGHDPVRGVAGTFENRNMLGGWLALMLPIVFGVALYAESYQVRMGLMVLFFCGLLVDLSAASVGAVLLVMLLLTATRGWRAFAAAVLAVTLWVALVTPHVGGFQGSGASGSRQTSQQALVQSEAFCSPGGQMERRYCQWQAAAEQMLANPWLGTGIGSRMPAAGACSHGVAGGASEPGTQSLYLLIGATMGLPALLGFLAMLVGPALLAVMAAPRHDQWRQGAVYGVGAGLAAFAMTAVWHPLLVRGIGLHLALLLVVARLLSDWVSRDQPGGEAVSATLARRTSGEAQGPDRMRPPRRRWRSPEHDSGRGSTGSSRSRS